ncbi:unnamed protein product [Amoebophrya sp. A25]|nr:unnamed protein product [Amoebophrya sp. A25]|eukprot:GSA25T00017247001.1
MQEGEHHTLGGYLSSSAASSAIPSSSGGDPSMYYFFGGNNVNIFSDTSGSAHSKSSSSCSEPATLRRKAHTERTTPARRASRDREIQSTGPKRDAQTRLTGRTDLAGRNLYTPLGGEDKIPFVTPPPIGDTHTPRFPQFGGARSLSSTLRGDVVTGYQARIGQQTIAYTSPGSASPLKSRGTTRRSNRRLVVEDPQTGLEVEAGTLSPQSPAHSGGETSDKSNEV